MEGVFDPFLFETKLSIRKYIREIIEAELHESQYFIVDEKSNEQETALVYYIDGSEALDISLCSRLSRKVSKALEESDLDYGALRYEISSPGADSPLLDYRQYPKHVGRELQVSTVDQGVLQGRLLLVNQEELKLEIKKDKKTKVDVIVPFEKVDKANVIVSFKKSKK